MRGMLPTLKRHVRSSNLSGSENLTGWPSYAAMPTPPLAPGTRYHIYNRGVNREVLFRSDVHYRRFLALLGHHVAPCARVYAFALLPNHFHFILEPHADGPRSCSQALSNAFNAYAKGYNLVTGRVGALFCRPFQRKVITNEAYAAAATRYVLLNAVKHGLVTDTADWPWSSWEAMHSERPTLLARDDVRGWLGAHDGGDWEGFDDSLQPQT